MGIQRFDHDNPKTQEQCVKFVTKVERATVSASCRKTRLSLWQIYNVDYIGKLRI